jgi:uncharacterized LabA/DUF88 family protein
MKSRLYIDGYNFYYSFIHDANLPNYLTWCDFRKLGQNLLEQISPGEVLGKIKYFTAPVGNLEVRKGERQRQKDWLRAVSTIPNLEIIKGYHQPKGEDVSQKRVEKQTDVNIATHMMMDAMMNKSDRLILISGDTDLITPVDLIVNNIPSPKKVDILFPSGEIASRWKKMGLSEVGYQMPTYELFNKSRFPEKIELNHGSFVEAPVKFKKK